MLSPTGLGRQPAARRWTTMRCSMCGSWVRLTQAPAEGGPTEGYGGRYDDGDTPGYMTDDTRICKLTVIASVEEIVTQVTAEDLNGTGAPKRTFGFVGSVCAERGLAR